MAKHRHKRESGARLRRPATATPAASLDRTAGSPGKRRAETPSRVPSAPVVMAPLAVLATVGAVSIGVTATGGQPVQEQAALVEAPLADLGQAADVRTDIVPGSEYRLSDTGERAAQRNLDEYRAEQQAMLEERQERQASRAAARETAVAVAAADTKLWTTAELNLWSTSGADAEQVGVLDEGKKVLVTGRTLGGRDEVVIDGASRWVTAGYLDEEEPVEETAAATGTGGTCSNGTSASGGVPNIVSVHASVCARWPEITSYGVFRAGATDHSSGRAIDIMVSGATGWEIANYLQANASAFGINYLIYEQKIWSVDRAGEGWRYMEDRGSVTANHYDHVHVSVW